MRKIDFLFMCLTTFILRGQAQTITNSNFFGCSTFMLYDEKSILIGHNLDMSMEIPGMIFINK